MATEKKTITMEVDKLTQILKSYDAADCQKKLRVLDRLKECTQEVEESKGE